MDSLEYIDGYYKGEFSPEETRQFEKRIQEDSVFAEEVAFYVSAQVAAKEERAVERKNSFREIYRNTTTQPEIGLSNVELPKIGQSKIRRLIPALAAAASVIGIVLCWWLFFNPASAPKLADNYIRQNLEILSVKMGATDSLQTGLRLYNEGKFREARQQFETILRADSTNSIAWLNAGLASLRMQDFDLALDFFKKLEDHTDPRINPALFYEALTLMKRNHAGDPARAKQILQEIVQKELDKKEEARELLKEM